MYSLHHLVTPLAESSRAGVMRFGVISPEEIRPVMNYLRIHEQPGDVVYVFYAAGTAFKYYAERDGFPLDKAVMGTAQGDDPRNALPQPLQFRA